MLRGSLFFHKRSLQFYKVYTIFTTFERTWANLSNPRFIKRLWKKDGDKEEKKGDLALVEPLLTRQLSTIAPKLRSQIQQLSNTQIEELAEALLDFSTTEDLVAWLKDHR